MVVTIHWTVEVTEEHEKTFTDSEAESLFGDLFHTEITNVDDLAKYETDETRKYSFVPDRYVTHVGKT